MVVFLDGLDAFFQPGIYGRADSGRQEKGRAGEDDEEHDAGKLGAAERDGGNGKRNSKIETCGSGSFLNGLKDNIVGGSREEDCQNGGNYQRQPAVMRLPLPAFESPRDTDGGEGREEDDVPRSKKCHECRSCGKEQKAERNRMPCIECDKGEDGNHDSIQQEKISRNETESEGKHFRDDFDNRRLPISDKPVLHAFPSIGIEQAADKDSKNENTEPAKRPSIFLWKHGETVTKGRVCYIWQKKYNRHRPHGRLDIDTQDGNKEECGRKPSRRARTKTFQKENFEKEQGKRERPRPLCSKSRANKIPDGQDDGCCRITVSFRDMPDDSHLCQNDEETGNIRVDMEPSKPECRIELP